MGVSVTTMAQTRRLTRKENVKREMPSAPATADDAFFDALVDSASAAIVTFCHREFARQIYSETLAGYGEVDLMLARTPIVGQPSSVLYDLSPITDWILTDPDAGILYRQVGWYWTAQVLSGLVGKQRWPGIGDPLPRQEEPRFTVAYTAGWLLPSQDLIGGTVSAAAADNSFNDSGNGFPLLLVVGDVVRTSGFAQAANNGTFLVASAAPGKVTVTLVNGAPANLVTETSGAGKNCYVSNLPFDVEQGAIETVKAWYLDRQKAPHSKRERVGEQDLEWTDPVGVTTALPVTAVGFLMAYQRAA